MTAAVAKSDGDKVAENRGEQVRDSATTAATDGADPRGDILKLAWVLLAEERRARRAHRQERRKFEKSERSNSRHHMRRSRHKHHRNRNNDAERENADEYYEQDIASHNTQKEVPVEQKVLSLDSSPLQKGNSRVGENRTQGSRVITEDEELYSGDGIREMVQMRPVLAWHEKARLLMKRWEEELRIR